MLRLGWLVDPRAHLMGVVVLLGSGFWYPELGRLANRVEDRAVSTLDRLGHGASVAMGLDECPGHLHETTSGIDTVPCTGTVLADSLPIY